MYELSRIRLYSVGPAGARYEDVIIDMSGAGSPVRHLQPMLGQTEALRPSPATILFLENGGGKSVLIKLIFSVMLPGRRQVVGTSNTKVLEKFVGRNDVAHVVLEWMHTQTGRLLLTGKISDWRGRSPHSDGDNLTDLWYCVRPGKSVDLTSLPFAEDGSNLAATEFRSRLNDLAADDPTLELDWAEKHGKWSERLASLGLDTELFRYQRAMNAGEGEAADTFTFTTDEAFVDFLLRAALPAGDAEDLANSVAGHAETLSRREELELEHTFVAEVLDLLGPLAAQQAVAVTARDHASAASAALGRFVARLASRAAREKALLAQGEEHVQRLRNATDDAGREKRRAEALHAALTYHLASLRLGDAHAARLRAESMKVQAELVVQGWKATGQLIEQEGAAEHARGLRAVVEMRQDAARTALEARDAKSRALARALLVTVDRAFGEAAKEDAVVADLRKGAGETEHSWSQAVMATADAEALAAQLGTRVGEVRTDMDAAVREGLVKSAKSLADEAVSLADQLRSDTSALADHERRLVELDDEVEKSRTELAEVRQEQTTARADHEASVEILKRAQVGAEALAGEARLVELIDTEAVVLEFDAETLLDQLAKAQDETDLERTGLRIADASDEPARLVWEEDPDALLLPPHEVTRIQQLLRAEGIHCWTGWDCLAGRSDETIRRELVRRLPHLAGGVLLNNPADLTRARDLIAENGYRPRGIVAIATTRSFDVAVDESFDLIPHTEAGFVVPPNPALFDHEAAKAECERITDEHLKRKHALARLDARYSADRDLAARVAAWRAEYPAGRLAELADDVAAATAKLADVTTTAMVREMALRVSLASRDMLRERLPDLRVALDNLKDRARKVSELARRELDARVWAREAEQAIALAATERGRAQQLRERLDRLRLDAEEHQRKADDHRALATRTRDDIATIQGDTKVSGAEPVPDQPVAVLRLVLRDAQRAYDKAEIGDDQLKELQQAEARTADAKKAFERNTNEVREIATQLLKSTAGADAASRASATERAERELAEVTNDQQAAVSIVGECTGRVKDLPKPTVVLDLAKQARETNHGEQLVAEAEAVAAQAKHRHDELVTDLEEARKALSDAKVTADAFVTITTTHKAAEEERADGDLTEVEPYGDDVTTAQTHYAELCKAQRNTHRTATEAERELRARAERLTRCAADGRFESLVIPIRTQILGVLLSELPNHAALWRDQLRPRLRSLSDELTQVTRHRAVIVERLRAMVDEALRTLRSAQRLSKLPKGLGEWSGEEFLRIAYTPIAGELLTHELGRVLDEAVNRHGANGKRDGTSILLRGVRAAVPTGFKVTMLKPDAVLRAERVRIAEVRDVFSGGQHLTAAIILYCTLAALRANNQGKVLRHHHSGVLFLDNPIGRASAGYLLDLQRGVAAALGVQLVYTTGLFDAEALGGFPLIVRLRNDADLRAGRKYLSVEHRVRAELDALAAPDGTGVLTSTRVLFQEREHNGSA